MAGLEIHQLLEHRPVVHAGVKLAVLPARIDRGRQVVEE
jgi:phosphate starvation-inducible protein PhoH